ncbi:MAG: DUF6288 domain-containing protein, partial [Verrucomicrobiota bacterium]
IPITVMGSYSETAPYDCPKSARILSEGCAAIAKNLKTPDGRRRHPIVRSLNAMALLASGNDQYLPLVKQEAEWASTWQIQEGALHCWAAGWVNLFLAEYVMVTGDQSVVPAITRLSTEIAEGQSHVGTWGHRFAYKHNGILRGYGAMNQVGLSLTTSLILAREAGVSDPLIDEAINKSQGFLRFYAGKGAIPYGDHHPWLNMHDDNGKASAAAVLFDLLEDGEATTFFSHMGLSSYGIERESGHTGNFFNMLWALPGVSRSGPEATGAWVAESAWLLDLARTWDGGFDFLGKPAATGGEHSYRGWDCTGAYLLSYALPHRKLWFTGSTASSAPLLSKAEAKQMIHEGRGWMPQSKAASYETRSTDELLENLSSWSPVIRERAALALAKQEDETLVDQLIAMAESDDLNSQFGACAAFEQLGARGADGIPALRTLLTSETYWIQAQAAEALAGIGTPARVAIPDLLELVAAPTSPDDHRGYLQRYLAFALFNQRGGLMGKSLEGADRDLLRDAARAVLENEDGRARGSLTTVYSQLTTKEIEPLLPAIYESVAYPAPSGVMFSDGIRMAGLKILAKHRIEEGLPLCLGIMNPELWGKKKRIKTCLEALMAYGGAARPMLPDLAKLQEQLKSHREAKGLEAEIKLIETTIKAIVNDANPLTTRSLKDL